jgi:hypothetical protein
MRYLIQTFCCSDTELSWIVKDFGLANSHLKHQARYTIWKYKIPFFFSIPDFWRLDRHCVTVPAIFHLKMMSSDFFLPLPISSIAYDGEIHFCVEIQLKMMSEMKE